MVREASGRIADAELLAEMVDKQSDSDAILDVLGFEVLLKAALIATGVGKKRGHDYVQLWNQLPGAARDEILTIAKDRMSGADVDYSDVDAVLVDWRAVFEEARYGYEMYESSEEMRGAAKAWLDAGAPEHKARIRYRPLELMGLTFALQTLIDRRLATTQAGP
jgi:hypothetical protein